MNNSNFLKRLRPEHLYWLYALWLFFYVALTLSPSSYGMALDAFKVGYETLTGEPRAIRSDEWAVWTPYTQMAVANGFERFYQSGLYQIDLRNFNQLPLWDWSLVFKPLMWGYFILPPATAFSLYYALMTLFFVVGWEKVIARFIGDVPHQKWLAVGFTLLMYFTGYIQYWWTTTGPLLAFAPWLILAVYNQSRWRYPFMFYMAACWLLSHTYPPIIVTLAYLAVGFIIADVKEWNKKLLLDYALKVVMCVAAAAVALYYYQDVMKVMSETVYPGKRVVPGGSVPLFMWLASIFPFIAQSGYRELLLNICEVGTGASFLPLLAVCFVDNKAQMLRQKQVYIWLILFALFSLWMLLPFPTILGKITLFSLVLENRMTFAAGFALNLAALFMIVHGHIRMNPLRVAVFAVIMLGIYTLPTAFGYIPFGEKLGWELLLIPVMAFLTWKPRALKLSLIGAAMAANLLYNINFNPLMSAKPIFDIIDSPTTAAFNAQKEPSGWVAVPGYFGATLTGIGVDSFTTVLMQPQFEIFRKIYPDMPSEEFNQLFNRYAHIHLTDDLYPYNPQPDVVRMPLKDISEQPTDSRNIWNIKTELSEASVNQATESGHIDSIKDQGKTLLIQGWAMTTKPNLTMIGIEKAAIKSAVIEPRPDVAKALSDHKLSSSGFQIVIDKDGIQNHFCIFSTDERYGSKKLAPPPNGHALYNCTVLPKTK